MMSRLLFVLLLILIAGCSGHYPNMDADNTPAADTNPEDINPSKPLRYLALGDSYTIGEAVLVEERWPNQLAQGLRMTGYPVDDLLIVAHTGWTTEELAQGIQQAEISPPYDLVSLLIGVNNQYRGYSQESYRQEFVALLEQAIAFAGGRPERVLVLSIPDWGVTPFGARFEQAEIAAQIDAFNAINSQESEQAGAWYIDVTTISRRADEDLSLVATDGLHPSGAMYAEWSALALQVALQALQK